MRILLAALTAIAAVACHDEAENMGSTPYDHPSLTSGSVDSGQTDFVGENAGTSGNSAPVYGSTLHAYGPPATATIPAVPPSAGPNPAAPVPNIPSGR